MKRLSAMGLAALVLGACGNNVNADVNGSTAVTVDKVGAPIVLVAVCHSTIDEVKITADRTGLKDTDPNVVLGTWKASGAQKGLVSLNLATPGSDWTSTDTFTPEVAKGYIVIAAQSKADVEATQVSFHGRDLANLTTDQVIVGDGTVQRRTAFANSCK